MTWIDCRSRKPTAEDGDPAGRVFARTKTRGVDIVLWACVQPHHVAWMPIPEFVPLKPPEPQYRPFANAEEFRPYRDRWWRNKSSPYLHPPTAYGEMIVALRTWQQAFDQLEFECGTPFGLPVDS